MAPGDPKTAGGWREAGGTGPQRPDPDDCRGKVEEILGFPVCCDPLPSIVDRAVSWIAAGDRGRYFVCANPHSLQVARHDQRFARAIREADLVVPDGAGIVLASRLLGGAIRARVTGTDLFAGVSARLDAERGRSCFFLGSTRENLEHLCRRMAETYPRIRIAGCHAPPFKSPFDAEADARMLRAVNAARPDVLWVGMTAPKQERWVHAHRGELEAGLIGPVGAVFDFFTGKVRRSSPWFQSHGLEWLPRLLREPRRLWRRNLVSSPAFLLSVLRERAAIRRAGRASRGA